MSEQKRKTKRTRVVEHIVRTADGGFKRLRLTRKLAMAAMCTECMGFEDNPTNCTVWRCPLFPYRAKTLVTRRGDITAAQLRDILGGNADKVTPTRARGNQTGTTNP